MGYEFKFSDLFFSGEDNDTKCFEEDDEEDNLLLTTCFLGRPLPLAMAGAP